MSNEAASIESDDESEVEVEELGNSQTLRGVDKAKPITLSFNQEYFQWIKTKDELITTVRLVEDTTTKQKFLMGSMIRGDLLDILEPFTSKENGVINIEQSIADRLNERLCLDLLRKKGEPGKPRRFKDVLTKDGYCFYIKAGKVRLWALRIPDVRINGEYLPCIIRIALCMKAQQHIVASKIMGIPMKEALRRTTKQKHK